MWLGGTRPILAVYTPNVRVVLEEGTVKIICPDCLLRSLQRPLFV